MSLIVDQSWVKDWAGKPTQFQKDTIVSWLTLQPKEWRELLVAFPPFCTVRAKKELEVPCLYSLGIVTGYDSDGRLLVRQDPHSEPELVSWEDLEVVGFWKELSPNMVDRFLS